MRAHMADRTFVCIHTHTYISHVVMRARACLSCMQRHGDACIYVYACVRVHACVHAPDARLSTSVRCACMCVCVWLHACIGVIPRDLYAVGAPAGLVHVTKGPMS